MSDKRWVASGIALGSVLTALVLLMVVISRAGPAAQGAPQSSVGVQGTLGTAFTYQGQLKSGGQPVNGTWPSARMP